MKRQRLLIGLKKESKFYQYAFLNQGACKPKYTEFGNKKKI